MMRLPDSGIIKSVKKHRCRLDRFSDWVEANILFEEDSLSITDVVDVLCTNTVYSSQNLQLSMPSWCGMSCPDVSRGWVRVLHTMSRPEP
jgi:hypothetical protein